MYALVVSGSCNVCSISKIHSTLAKDSFLGGKHAVFATRGSEGPVGSTATICRIFRVEVLLQPLDAHCRRYVLQALHSVFCHKALVTEGEVPRT